jgi:hypothetical protein
MRKLDSLIARTPIWLMCVFIFLGFYFMPILFTVPSTLANIIGMAVGILSVFMTWEVVKKVIVLINN